MDNISVPESVPALGWVFTGVLLLVAIICWAAGRGKIELNGTIGLRIPPLTHSTEAWMSGHAAGVRPAAIAFVVGLVLCVIGIFAPVAFWGAIVAFVGGLVWVTVAAVRAASRV